MRYLWVAVLLASANPYRVEAQKPGIDTTVFGRWPSVGKLAFTRDGRYYGYSISYKVARYGAVTRKLWVLEDVQRTWRREFENVEPGVFTRDSRSAIALFPGDSLCVVPLGPDGGAPSCEPRVRSFSYLEKPPGEWIVYQPADSDPSIGIRDLSTGKDSVLTGVTSYQLTSDGAAWLFSDTAARTLTIQSTTSGRLRSLSDVISHWLSPNGATIVALTGPASGAGTRELAWIDVASGDSRVIWSAHGATSTVESSIFDASNGRLAFVVTDQARPDGHVLWYYRDGNDEAERIIDDQSLGLPSGWRLQPGWAWQFSHDGQRLMVTAAPPTPSGPGAQTLPVTIWSYASSDWRGEGGGVRTGIIDLRKRQLRFLTETREDLRWISNEFGEFAWVSPHESGEYWSRRDSVVLLSTATGERTYLGALRPEYANVGGYTLWRDSSFAIHSTNLATGVTRNITGAIPTQVVDPREGRVGGRFPRVSIDASMPDGRTVIMHDRYDLWQVDLEGERPAVNLTNGYGRRNRMMFRLLGSQGWGGVPVESRRTLVVTAFDLATKESGFYRLTIGRGGDPEKLTLGPYHYEETSATPVGTGDLERYVVQRESATESPNYFSTVDFKTFTPLTEVYPERNYRWMRAELTEWTSPEGKPLQGIVYKPEDFDPSRKYPVIFLYYEKLSDELHHYQPPEPMWGWINVPWYLSRGYVVVFPDVFNTIGWPARSAYYALESAAAHLARFPWVDSTRMGIFGHSFGGFETNAIVTRTSRFAAAVSAAGWVDVIDYYNRPDGGQDWYEGGQGGIYATLWDRPDLYLENSAILCADRVTTPILINANSGDDAILYSQGLAWFRALRRLGKKAWLLQYDGSGHLVNGLPSQLDYTIRVGQFFDHYLKGAPAPKWMTQGLVNGRGTVGSLELDDSGATPGPGIVKDESGRKNPWALEGCGPPRPPSPRNEGAGESGGRP